MKTRTPNTFIIAHEQQGINFRNAVLNKDISMMKSILQQYPGIVTQDIIFAEGSIPTLAFILLGGLKYLDFILAFEKLLIEVGLPSLDELAGKSKFLIHATMFSGLLDYAGKWLKKYPDQAVVELKYNLSAMSQGKEKQNALISFIAALYKSKDHYNYAEDTWPEQCPKILKNATPIDIACARGHDDLVRLCLNLPYVRQYRHLNDTLERVLSTAIIFNNGKLVNWLMDDYKIPEEQNLSNVNFTGTSAYARPIDSLATVAAVFGRETILKKLLQEPYSANPEKKLKSTLKHAIFHAAMYRDAHVSSQMLRIIHEYGFNLLTPFDDDSINIACVALRTWTDETPHVYNHVLKTLVDLGYAESNKIIGPELCCDFITSLYVHDNKTILEYCHNKGINIDPWTSFSSFPFTHQSRFLISTLTLHGSEVSQYILGQSSLRPTPTNIEQPAEFYAESQKIFLFYKELNKAIIKLKEQLEQGPTEYNPLLPHLRILFPNGEIPLTIVTWICAIDDEDSLPATKERWTAKKKLIAKLMGTLNREQLFRVMLACIANSNHERIGILLTIIKATRHDNFLIELTALISLMTESHLDMYFLIKSGLHFPDPNATISSIQQLLFQLCQKYAKDQFLGRSDEEWLTTHSKAVVQLKMAQVALAKPDATAEDRAFNFLGAYLEKSKILCNKSEKISTPIKTPPQDVIKVPPDLTLKVQKEKNKCVAILNEILSALTDCAEKNQEISQVLPPTDKRVRAASETAIANTNRYHKLVARLSMGISPSEDDAARFAMIFSQSEELKKSIELTLFKTVKIIQQSEEKIITTTADNSLLITQGSLDTDPKKDNSLKESSEFAKISPISKDNKEAKSKQTSRTIASTQKLSKQQKKILTRNAKKQAPKQVAQETEDIPPTEEEIEALNAEAEKEINAETISEEESPRVTPIMLSSPSSMPITPLSTASAMHNSISPCTLTNQASPALISQISVTPADSASPAFSHATLMPSPSIAIQPNCSVMQTSLNEKTPLVASVPTKTPQLAQRDMTSQQHHERSTHYQQRGPHYSRSFFRPKQPSQFTNTLSHENAALQVHGGPSEPINVPNRYISQPPRIHLTMPEQPQLQLQGHAPIRQITNYPFSAQGPMMPPLNNIPALTIEQQLSLYQYTLLQQYIAYTQAWQLQAFAQPQSTYIVPTQIQGYATVDSATLQTPPVIIPINPSVTYSQQGFFCPRNFPDLTHPEHGFNYTQRL